MGSSVEDARVLRNSELGRGPVLTAGDLEKFQKEFGAWKERTEKARLEAVERMLKASRQGAGAVDELAKELTNPSTGLAAQVQTDYLGSVRDLTEKLEEKISKRNAKAGDDLDTLESTFLEDADKDFDSMLDRLADLSKATPEGAKDAEKAFDEALRSYRDRVERFEARFKEDAGKFLK